MLILFLPLVIMGFFLLRNFIDILEDEILANNFNTMIRVKNAVDVQMSQIKDISSLIFLNKDLRPFYFGQDPDKAITARDQLKNFAVTNSFIHEIFIYYHGDNYIYSNSSSYEVSNFINKMYKYENWTEKDFYKDINSIALPTVRPSENVSPFMGQKDKFVTIMYPISGNGARPYATLLFIIKESSFSDLLKNAVKDYHSTTIIADNKNNFIITLNGGEHVSLIDLKTLESGDGHQISKTVELNNKKYFLLYIDSNQTGWKYITLIPVSEVLQKVVHAQLLFIYGAILILLVGSILIYYIMNINYRPIAKLKKHAETIGLNSKDKLDEIELVHKTIDFLSEQNTNLNNKIIDNRAATKSYLLTELIKGRFDSIEEFNNRMIELGSSLNAPYFLVAILNIYSSKASNLLDKQDLIKVLEELSTEACTLYVLDHIDDHKLMLILNVNSYDYMELSKVFINIQNLLKERFNYVAAIGVGNVYEDIISIPKSYMEASTAIDYRLIKGNDTVIFFKEVFTDKTKFIVFPEKEFEELRNSIISANTPQIESVLLNLLNFIKKNNMPIFIVRGLCFDIINVVVKTTESINKNFSIPSKYYPDVFLLTEFETVDELVNLIKIICLDISAFIQKNKTNVNSNTINEMITYLNEHFTECNFSIQEMADNFNLSLPNLSQYFKDKTGQTVIDFVTELKMNKAKDLLSSTDMALKDISIEVGYYNPSSFIRRFKQVIGLTPGEYRKYNKQD